MCAMSEFYSGIRRCLQLCLFLLGGICCHALAGDAPPSIKVGLTPIFTSQKIAQIESWKPYWEEKLGTPVEFVVRNNYREMIDLLKRGKVDFAWVSAYPVAYVMSNHIGKVVATPLYNGRPVYQSYLIVPAADDRTRTLLDLKGKVFAYSDPYSNSGYLVPRFTLKKAGFNPATFFRKTFFTYSHENVFKAVLSGLANGGSLDGYVFEMAQEEHPDYMARLRVVEKSGEFGFPPFVAAMSVDDALLKRFSTMLLGMSQNEEGRRLLRGVRLDGFVPGEPRLYESVINMMRSVGDL